MKTFERLLSFWVASSICLGILLGTLLPSVFTSIAKLEWAHVNILVAILIWTMIFPMMVQVDFRAMKNIRNQTRPLIFTVVINWLIKPFTMTGLSLLFFKVLYADWLDPSVADEYIAGMILLGVAPCTAMVFLWSQLAKGDPNYTLIQVSVNDLIMVFAFAPLAGLLLGINSIEIPWGTLALSVFLYVVVPLILGILTRNKLERSRGRSDLDEFLAKCQPYSRLGLLATIVLLFGFQATVILQEPHTIALIAVPLLIQTYGIFAIAYWLSHALKFKHTIAAPASFIGSSNFFELAVAVAISLFGLHSGAALATVVGVLVEVPVMLSLVFIANRTSHLFRT